MTIASSMAQKHIAMKEASTLCSALQRNYSCPFPHTAARVCPVLVSSSCLTRSIGFPVRRDCCDFQLLNRGKRKKQKNTKYVKNIGREKNIRSQKKGKKASHDRDRAKRLETRNFLNNIIYGMLNKQINIGFSEYWANVWNPPRRGIELEPHRHHYQHHHHHHHRHESRL